jgi:Tfp pilus assembly protein PilN
MESIHGTVMDLIVVWGVVTALLVILVVYRTTISNREDDQVFLGSTADQRSQEQQEIVRKIERLAMPIKLLSVASVVLILAAGGAKMYEYFQSF